MRAIRDPFARETLRPVRNYASTGCSWCGGQRHTMRRSYTWDVTIESDGSRDTKVKGTFDSWECFEAYHGVTVR